MPALLRGTECNDSDVKMRAHSFEVDGPFTNMLLQNDGIRAPKSGSLAAENTCICGYRVGQKSCDR